MYRCDPNVRGSKQTLHRACQDGQHDIVKVLVNVDGCDLNAKDEYEKTPLHYACYRSHAGIIGELLRHGADPNLVDCYGDTPLHKLTRVGPENVDVLESLQCLLEAPNCNPNTKNRFGMTLIHWACRYGNLDIVTLLIEKYHCNPNVRDNYKQMTPLHYACQGGRYGVVKVLVSVDECDLNGRDKGGRTPLHYACSRNDTLIIRKLVQHGADPNLADCYGDTPLHEVMPYENVVPLFNVLESLKCLLEAPNCNPNIKSKSGLTLLLRACQYGNLSVITLLIERYNCDLNVRDNKQMTPLHHACQGGWYDIVKVLVNVDGCDLNAKDIDEKTPLHYACVNNHTGIIGELVQHGAESNLVDRFGDTSLHKLIAPKSHVIPLVNVLESLKCLLEAPNCNPNIKSKSGLTLLRCACQYSDPNIITLLIEKYQCDPNVRDSEQMAPLHHACQDGQHDIVKVLVSVDGCDLNAKDNDGKTPLHYACSLNHTGIIGELVQHGADPNVVDRDGDTPLHKLMPSENVVPLVNVLESLKCLLDAPNCNPNIARKFGVTVIHCACRYGNIDVITLLIEKYQCDPNVRDCEQMTPLHHACQGGHCDIIKVLVNVDGCDLNAKDKGGLTPLHYACVCNHTFIIGELVRLGADPNLVDQDGDTPLHKLLDPKCYRYGIMGSVKYLLEAPNYDPNVRNRSGQTLIQIALLCKDVILLKELVASGADPNFTDKLGNTLLHLVSKCGRQNELRLLLQIPTCNPNIKNNAGLTAIQVTRSGEILSELVQHGADCNVVDEDGNTPLHSACNRSDFDTTKRLLEASGINPNAKNFTGLTPLQVSSDTTIIRELIRHGAHCNVADDDGNTPLHSACDRSDRTIAKCLLEAPGINPNAKNNTGLTPLQVTSDTTIIRELIRHGGDAKDVYRIYGGSLKKPLQPPVKVFVVGNPSVGKSTLTAALKQESSFFVRTFTTAQKVTGVDKKTAGIVPHEFESKEYGCTTLYDFAGQREFYGSHAALLLNAIQSSPPVFLIVADLRESEEEITHTVLYWLTFLENQCPSVSDKPHVIIVGSHADVLRAREEDPELKTSCLKPDTAISFSRLVFVGFIAMDCQYPESRGMDKLRRCLKSSCNILRLRKTISFNAHCFYVYLVDKYKDTVAVTVEQIQAQIQAEEEPPSEQNLMSFIPDSLHHLCRICDELNDRGHVLFLKDLEAIEKSWIVIDKESLLANVSGSIFAPEHFKQHKAITQCSCSTGVVPLSSIAKDFPEHNSKMLTKFLSCLEYCREISDSEILHRITAEHQTCMVSGPLHSPRERYFLFPALVSLDAPRHVWDDKPECTHHCGWILRCSTERPEQFFTSRFLQVVLLRIAFSFPLSGKDTLSAHPAIQRNCSIWKNGIFWANNHGVESLVQVVPDNKAVIVLMRCDKTGLTNLAQIRSQVICKVKIAANEFCSRIDTVESFIDPSETTQYKPLKPVSPLKLFSISNISIAVLDTKTPARVVSPTRAVLLERLVPCEPYAGLGEDILREMFEAERDQDIEKIPDSSLSRVAQVMAKNSDLFIRIFTPEQGAPNTATACDILSVLKTWRAGCAGTYKSLREKLDEFSVFAGRDPLALAGVTGRQQRSKQDTTPREPPSTQDEEQNEEGPPVIEESDVPKLADLVFVLKAVDWHSLGLQLDISSTDLNEIDDQYPQRKIDRKRCAMFEHWLANEPDPSWKKIVTALERVGGHNRIIRTIQREYLDNCIQDTDPLSDGSQREVVSAQGTDQDEEESSPTQSEYPENSTQLDESASTDGSQSEVVSAQGTDQNEEESSSTQSEYLENSTQLDQSEITDGSPSRLTSSQGTLENEEESPSTLGAAPLTGNSQRRPRKPRSTHTHGSERTSDEEWCVKPIPLKSDQPTLKQLQDSAGGGRRVRVIESVAAEWEHLAIALGFEAPVIDYLKRDFSLDSK